MRAPQPHFQLRLVAPDSGLGVVAPGSQADTRVSPASDDLRAVREETMAAAHASLDPSEPHWKLAMETYRSLTGATLPPEQRERLLRMARRLGVRTFDASVVMAMTQDRARRGESLDGLVRLLPRAGAAMPQPAQSASMDRVLALLVVSGVLGSLIAAIVASWIAGA